MNDHELSLQMKARAGLASVKEATVALHAALSAFACALDEQDTHRLVASLPPSAAAALRRTPKTTVRDADEFFAEVARCEHVGLGFAREHGQVALECLADMLDPDLTAALRARLPPSLATLLCAQPKDVSEGPAYVHVHPEHVTPARQTLSSARPGYADSMAEAQHELAHSQSVARSGAPHADRMVETAHSTRPGQEDDTLAGAHGRPAGPSKT